MKICILYTDYSKQAEEFRKLDPHGAEQMELSRSEIKRSLEKKGHQVEEVAVSFNMLNEIIGLGKVDLVFDISSGLNQKREMANVIGMLELLGIPFKGSSLASQIKCIHKSLAKSLFEFYNIPSPKYQVFRTGDEKLKKDLAFPLIVKPNSEGASLGITQEALVHEEEELYSRIKVLKESFREDILVEEFLTGREFTVGILGNKNPEVLPILEIGFLDGDDEAFQSQEVKNEERITKTCPAKISKELEKEIKEISLKAYQLLDLKDYSRIDIRLDNQDKLNIIEVNSNPMLVPGYSDFPYIAEFAGYSYDDLIEKMVEVILEKSK